MWDSSAAQAHYMNQQQQPPQQQQVPSMDRGQPPPQHYAPPPQHMQQPQPPQHGGGVPVQAQHVMQQPPQQMMPQAHPQQKPRGKMTPYACFVKVIRAEHKKKHPNESIVFSEFSKKCAEKWRQMTDKEKRRFQEMAEKDKERFENEMQHYQPPDGMAKGRVKKRKKPKDPDAPKRALSAFMWFCKDFRHEVKEKNPEMRMGDIAKVLSERWKVAVNKEFYENRANEDKSRYADAMKIFRATKGVGPHGGKVTNAQARAAGVLTQPSPVISSPAPPPPVQGHLPTPVTAVGAVGPVAAGGPPPEKKSRRDSSSSSSGSGSSSDSSSESEGEQE